MTQFKDFDAAWAEAGGDEAHPDLFMEFQLAGEKFLANFSPKAGEILDWMADENRLAQIPRIVKTILTEGDYDRLRSLNIKWQRLEPVITWMVENLAGEAVGKGLGSETSTEDTEQP